MESNLMKNRVLSVLAVVVALVAAGCGSKEAEDNTPPPADAAKAPVSGSGAAGTPQAATPNAG